MKSLTRKSIYLLTLIAVFQYTLLCGNPTNSGFYLPEPIDEVTIRYKSINNLIVLPVVINGNIRVNLILDTGTRSLVLFGRRFQELFEYVPGRKVQFSGMGSGRTVQGNLSLGNKVELRSLTGEMIPIVVVPNKNIFVTNPKIDGIIGYDIFQKFEVEINPKQKLVSFRSPTNAFVPDGFVQLPLQIDKTIPILDSKISFDDGGVLATRLMIDTGSQLEVLIKTTSEELMNSGLSELLGQGVSGSIEGIKTIAETVQLPGINFINQSAGIILSDWHNYGSIGMGTLKEYVIILNYIGGYACLKKLKS